MSTLLDCILYYDFTPESNPPKKSTLLANTTRMIGLLPAFISRGTLANCSLRVHNKDNLPQKFNLSPGTTRKIALLPAIIRRGTLTIFSPRVHNTRQYSPKITSSVWHDEKDSTLTRYHPWRHSSHFLTASSNRR